MDLKKQVFPTPKGNITWVTITNENGAQVVLSSLGAGIVSIKLPDEHGTLTDVAIGYDNPTDYFADGPCAGKTPGRYANRIALGKFSIGDKEYSLPVNNGPNHLHGGPDGFQNRIWDCTTDGDNTVVFIIESIDGDAGYPANIKASVKYTWDNGNNLRIDYEATADAPTVINLTNHTYFNLDGHDSGSCLNHLLALQCSRWLPTDDTLIPTGHIEPVKNTPMDFTSEHTLGERIHDDFPALTYGKGYDNCWLADTFDGEMHPVAALRSTKSGRKLTVSTNQPALQIYTGNWLNGSPKGKGGYDYRDYDAVAIECQGCPDAPNQPGFPSQRLNPGEVYRRAIQFSCSC